MTSANQLVEKIQIFDAGKDDRVMELVKLLATDSILKNDPDIEFDELRFAVDDDGTNILVISAPIDQYLCDFIQMPPAVFLNHIPFKRYIQTGILNQSTSSSDLPL